jgi:hypothetical protein
MGSKGCGQQLALLCLVFVWSTAAQLRAQAPLVPPCEGDDCVQRTAASSADPNVARVQPLHAFDLTLSGFYRFGKEVDEGDFGFGALAGVGGHIVPQYALQLVGGVEVVQRSPTSSLLGLGVRRDEVDGSSMVRVVLSVYLRHPRDGLPGYADNGVKLGFQGRIDALFRAGSAFLGFGVNNVIISGSLLISLCALVAVE